MELELASGERPRTDGPSDLILKANAKTRLPLEVVARFLHEKAGNFRARNYQFNPMTLAKAFTQDVIPWLKKNTLFVEETHRRAEIERRRAAELRQMKSPEWREQQRKLDERARHEPEQTQDPQFAAHLLNDMQKRKGA